MQSAPNLKGYWSGGGPNVESTNNFPPTACICRRLNYQLQFEWCLLYLVCIILDVTGFSGRQRYSIRETIDVNPPRHTHRVDWGFKPTQIAFLILVVEVNDGSLFEASSQIDLNSTVTPHVASGDSNALWLEMRESLDLNRVKGYAIHHAFRTHRGSSSQTGCICDGMTVLETNSWSFIAVRTSNEHVRLFSLRLGPPVRIRSASIEHIHVDRGPKHRSHSNPQQGLP